MYKLICFDLFFTLVKPEYYQNPEYEIVGVSEKNWEAYMEDYDLYIRRATGVITKPKEIICEVLNKSNISLPDEKIDLLVKSRIDRFRNVLTNIESKVMQTLTCLKQFGIPMAVISNSDSIDVMYWEESPLYNFFIESVFSYKLGYVKPDKRIFTYLLKKLKIDASACLYIGDGGSYEIETARHLGMKTVLVTHFSSYYSDTEADYKIGDFSKLLGIITEKN